MYMDMDKLNSSLGFYGLEGGGESVQATPQAPYPNENMMVSPSEKPLVKHQQSLSFDGLTSTKPELLISSPEWTLSAESRKALSAAKLAEIALVNPKLAKRILGNRQSAARSKECKRRYVSELEQKVKDLETKVTALSAQLEMAKLFSPPK
ncbi:Basic-leucine zipper domain-containing protein [Cinnamomum micranthum f. kanehirae]|uniref:Basic-leucine zipper domain-containing protein n=1 Tax=Cinnamomum micranthum f. kanehirae TaxID=337451 RepID=A0A3S3QFX8_9MAGN|nr:Basic-leucine zipper domain-containing protein [Cinnamomum micranthum f. kanehirae]